MKCPVCGGAELIHEARDVPFTYKGRKFIVEGVIGQHCPACGETIMTEAESDTYAAKTMLLRKMVNTESIAPAPLARSGLSLSEHSPSDSSATVQVFSF
ncbi:XRE family transcriptional regulator [Yersinia pekkanenii]|uniref:XRE family transcriptional regulator n=1 Tax=Yersinia pekkanenii TaxID=1288385 RepID=A0A0T9P9H5_9GAMM|nr:XRE family transcriptional regulator [Yersinia pekkanenii]CRY68720.1 XRE family transcriptional regulator [Yersinia pekkanenii]